MHEKTKKLLTGVGAIAAAGAVTAGIAGAAKSSDRDGKCDRPADAPHGFERGHHVEPALTGETKAKAEAAALEAVPGATVMRSSEEDPPEGTGAKYEVHLRKADGGGVEVLLDADFKVLEKRDRPAFGPGGHRGGPGGPGGPRRGTPLTGDTAEKAKEAAQAAVPGGTVRGALEVPAGREADAKYVVFVARKSGRPVIVLLDAGFEVVRKLTGPPRGRHGHPPGGPPPA